MSTRIASNRRAGAPGSKPFFEAASAKKSPSTNLLRGSAVSAGPSGNTPLSCQSITASSASIMTRDFGRRYTQHNPTAADGPEGLKSYIAFLKDKFPNSRSEIKHIFADGDYVIVHDHAVREPGTRGIAIVNIYKLENGKVVEHWDVMQPVPEKPANNNGMF